MLPPLPSGPVGGGEVTHLAAGFFGDAGPVTIWAVVLTFVFLECASILGLFLPGDSLLFAAGVLLAEQGHESGTWVLAGVATVVAVTGNQVGYLVGRYTGTRMLARKEGRVLNRANLARATAFFERWGFWAIVVARWIPWIRTLAPMIAGAARMDNRRFLVANAVGAVCWVPTLVLLGFYGAALLDTLPWIRTAATVAAVVGFVLGTAVGVYRFRQEMRRPIDEDSPHPEDAFAVDRPRPERGSGTSEP
jgi:membrane-associated protein